MPIDQKKLDEFIGRFAGDFAAAMHAATVVVGDKLGLYRALATTGPATPAEVARQAGCDERYVQEWLSAQYASGYCDYDPTSGRFWLTEEQAACLADPASPALLVGAMTIAGSLMKDEDVLREAFRTGRGVGWHEHHHDLFDGTERLFKPGYVANLVSSWIPALDGVDAKLRAGAKVADVGCGYGASTLLLGDTYPASEVVGFDYHDGSIEAARKRAADAGLADRVTFDVASASDFPGDGYDLVCIFDALHDMGDPVGAARHIRRSLAPDGTLLFVEPQAGERLEDNVNPVGRIFYSASTFICTPSAKAQDGGVALGAQVPDSTWRQLLEQAGFTRFRRATETPFNRVFEARP
ncbi:MAG: class I SAM-dependent methyltransferase [Acidimicrobiales bacterium]